MPYPTSLLTNACNLSTASSKPLAPSFVFPTSTATSVLFLASLAGTPRVPCGIAGHSDAASTSSHGPFALAPPPRPPKTWRLFVPLTTSRFSSQVSPAPPPPPARLPTPEGGWSLPTSILVAFADQDLLTLASPSCGVLAGVRPSNQEQVCWLEVGPKLAWLSLYEERLAGAAFFLPDRGNWVLGEPSELDWRPSWVRDLRVGSSSWVGRTCKESACNYFSAWLVSCFTSTGLLAVADLEAGDWSANVCLPGCLVGWLVGWLLGWLAGWLAWKLSCVAGNANGSKR